MTNIFNQSQPQTGGTYLGSVTLPGATVAAQETRKEDAQSSSKEKEEPQSTSQQDTTAPSPPTEPPRSSAASEPVKVAAADASMHLAALRSLASPLSSLRAYKGTRTLKTMTPLFAFASFKKAGIEQFPQIGVSDGTTAVTVRIGLDSRSLTPRFSLKGAKLLAIRRPNDKAWEMDIVPAKGAYDVQVTLLIGKEYADVPMFVVPPLSPLLAQVTGDLSDAAVDALLAKAGGAQAAKAPYDMNGDGKQDYVDDYILLGHHLKKTLKKSTSKAEKR